MNIYAKKEYWNLVACLKYKDIKLIIIVLKLGALHPYVRKYSCFFIQASACMFMPAITAKKV